MDEARRKLLEAFKGCKTARTTTTIFLYSPEREDEVMKEIEKALRRGEALHLSDGSQEWIDVFPVEHHGKCGSERYVWDKDGEKVLHERFRVFRSKDGELTRTKIGETWRKL